MLYPGTCVSSEGSFVHGIHKPVYQAQNRRVNDFSATLGKTRQGQQIHNDVNFPRDDVEVKTASWVYEIPNPFPFMGATFIPKDSAGRRSHDCNPFRTLLQRKEKRAAVGIYDSSHLDVSKEPRLYLLTLAKFSQDPRVLKELAALSCQLMFDDEGTPIGLLYEGHGDEGERPVILDEDLFDLVSNNPFLPDSYKRCLVLNPGVQGNSPVMGEYGNEQTHIWEYLRKNSYIPWGHYAANMAQDAVRYSVGALSMVDMAGLRHLYYQRIYLQLAQDFGIPFSKERRPLSVEDLESVRKKLLDAIEEKMNRQEIPPFNGNIWGQNYGFDLSPSGYRLNASHQQIHQQYALVPSMLPMFQGGKEVSKDLGVPTFVVGDLVTQFAKEYRTLTGQPFFKTYINALWRNVRTDGSGSKPASLIIYEDERVAIFVPKAQRSQGEIQIITKVPCGNILEADAAIRESLDYSVFVALQILEGLGAEMMAAFEISKRFDNPDTDQRLMYCFLPKHPQSPGSFTEFQQRWIIGHYPEDFAETCRQVLKGMV